MVGGRGRRLGRRALPCSALVTPPSHFVTASATPARGPLGRARLRPRRSRAPRLAAPAYRRWIDPTVGIAALYVLSLGILDLAERMFGGSIETDFERGHVAVSVLWTLIGLGLLIAGLIRDSRLLRYGGLTLFGLSLAKIFLYDLSALNSVARALSFIVVGALVLAGGFFLQRLSAQRRPPAVVGRHSSPRSGLSGVGGIAGREHVARPLAPLPVRDRRLVVVVGNEARPLDELQPVHVPGAVRQDVGRAHAHDQLRLGILARAAGRRSSIEAIPFTRSRFGLVKSMNRIPTCGLRSRFPSDR